MERMVWILSLPDELSIGVYYSGTKWEGKRPFFAGKVCRNNILSRLAGNSQFEIRAKIWGGTPWSFPEKVDIKNRQIQVRFDNRGIQDYVNIKRTYTKQFKEEAIALCESSGKSASAIEQESGITAVIPICVLKLFLPVMFSFSTFML